jgi:hypothetical protein
MPAPDDKSSKGYQWVYNLLQFLLANLGQLQSFVTKSAEPGPKQPQVCGTGPVRGVEDKP